MHEPVNYDNVWIFIIAGIFLVCAMLLFMPRLMNYLDNLVDRKYEARKSEAAKEKKADDNLKKDE